MQIHPKSYHDGSRTPGPTLVAFEGNHWTTGATRWNYIIFCFLCPPLALEKLGSEIRPRGCVCLILRAIRRVTLLGPRAKKKKRKKVWSDEPFESSVSSQAARVVGSCCPPCRVASCLVIRTPAMAFYDPPTIVAEVGVAGIVLFCPRRVFTLCSLRGVGKAI